MAPISLRDFPQAGGFFERVSLSVSPSSFAASFAGFTLPELLVVVAVVATLASVAWGGYVRVHQENLDQLGRVQLDEASRALRQFHADTGYWPGAGPFSLVPVVNVETPSGSGSSCSNMGAGGVPRSSLPSVEVVSGLDDQAEWFAHPANLWQLAWQPALCVNHPQARLAAWDAESGRGWRGPYISPDKLRFVDVSNTLQADGTGDASAQPTRRDLHSLGAGGEQAPVDPGYGNCTTPGDCAFQWRILRRTASGYDAGEHDLARHGSPLLYFGPASGRPRLVYLGMDGRFGGPNSNDPCAPNATADGGADDVVACLE